MADRSNHVKVRAEGLAMISFDLDKIVTKFKL